VTQAVDQLERRDLVERCVFEGDKRGYLATITAKGRAFLTKATNVHLQGLRKHFLNHLTRSELKQLADVLETILEGEGSPLPPLTAS
jgi:DNA-binding MarR family transcriptional regulator